jgi:uncharacterized membrane protein
MDDHEPFLKPESDTFWTYRGYRLESGSFANAMIHLYRGEAARALAWRNRLDVTTNWAVISTGAAMSFAFAQPETHHGVIILISLLVTLFLLIESRRYRYYELWSYRVRLMETEFFSAMLVPPFRPDPKWAALLSEALIRPQFPITMWQAFGIRLSHNYIWIYLVLLVAWLAKLLLYPEGITSISELVARSHMGALSGWIVLMLQAAFYGTLVAIMVHTMRQQHILGEIQHRPAEEIAKQTATAPQPEIRN